MMERFALYLTSFLLGSLPTAYIVVGERVLREGSGNVGALNTWRLTRSVPKTLLVLVTDLLKGILPVYLSLLFFDPLTACLSLFFSVLGHNFSPYLGFKGGRGLAPLLGAMLLLSPPLFLLFLVLWAIFYALTGYIIGGTILAISVLSLLPLFGLFSREVFILSLALLLVLVKLVPKVVRIWKGEEPRHFWQA